MEEFEFGDIVYVLPLVPAGAPFTINDVSGNVVYTVTRITPAPELDIVVDESVMIGAEEVSTEQAILNFSILAADVLDQAGGVFELRYTITAGGVDYDYTAEFAVGVIVTEEAPSDFLVVGGNTYQTYADALALQREIFGIQSFKAGSEEDRVAALVNSYHVINTMTFTDRFGEYYNLGDLDETALQALEPAFLKALRIAQVIEANELMDSNSIHYKRLDGLMSETIGESSMMFRPGNINNYPITRRSMMFLRNYILLRARLFRA